MASRVTIQVRGRGLETHLLWASRGALGFAVLLLVLVVGSTMWQPAHPALALAVDDAGFAAFETVSLVANTISVLTTGLTMWLILHAAAQHLRVQKRNAGLPFAGQIVALSTPQPKGS